MKKIKILSSLVLMTPVIGLTAPLVTSCGNQTVNPIIDEETTEQFANVKTNCIVGKDSTIEFTPKQDQELDHNSVEVRVSGIRIKASQDYKVEGNTITIYAKAMTSTIVNVKANTKYSHVIDTIKPSWVIKPLMKNDGMTAKDIKVELVYKDGEKETLAWNTGYKIYSVEDGEIEEIPNFDTQAFVFEKTNVSYNFQIKYVPNPNIKVDVKDIMVVEPYAEAFYRRYSDSLELFKETKNKYGWAQVNNGDTYESHPVTSAAIYYDDDGKTFADFKNDASESVGDNPFCIGGNTLSTIKSFIDSRLSTFGIVFENDKDSFGFTLSNGTETIKAVFDKYSYVKQFIYEPSGSQYSDTSFSFKSFELFKKTATIKPETYGVTSPIEKIIIETTKGNNYVADDAEAKENQLWAYVYPRNPSDNRRGRLVIYNEDNVPVYTSVESYLDRPLYLSFDIYLTNWDLIKHNDNLTVKFETDKQIHVSLDDTTISSSKYNLYIDNKSSNTIYEDGVNQPNVSFYIEAKDGSTSTFNGTFKIKCKSKTSGEDIEIARTEYKEQTGLQIRDTLKFIDNTWKDISLSKDVTEATFSFEESRKAGSFVLGDNLKNNFGTVTHTQVLQESTEVVPLSVSWQTPLEKESMFALMNSKGENIYSKLLQPGTTNVSFDFLPEWFNKFESGTDLTFEIKKEYDIEFAVDPDKTTYSFYEPAGRIVTELTMIDTFAYADHSQTEAWLGVNNIRLTLAKWKPIKIVGDEFKLWDNHSAQTFATEPADFFLVQLFVRTPEADALAGSEYEYALTFEYESSTSYKKQTIDGLRIKIIDWESKDSNK